MLTYTYDACGNFTKSLISSPGFNYYAIYNPFTYRGYYYDSELGMYYLQSRYYDPAIGRFINADTSINANGDILGFNMFAYCGSNPVMGFDPTGEWNWGGFLIGLGIVAATVITIATFGVGSGAGAVVATAAITTGACMMYAAATESAMVVDISGSIPLGEGLFGKIGLSFVIDFKKDNGGVFLYGHAGPGLGLSAGLSYSVGLVENFDQPSDYSGLSNYACRKHP